MNIKLKSVREDSVVLSPKEKLLQHFWVFIAGVVLGSFAKYADTVPSNVIPGLSDIFSYLGLYIFLVTLLAAWSHSPKTAAINSLLFLLALVETYYLYSFLLYGFIAIKHFMFWNFIAFISPIPAFILWYSRGKGLLADLCAAFPIGFLLNEGFSFFYVLPLHAFQLGFDLLIALILLFILPQNQNQRIRVSLFSIIIFILMISLTYG